MRRSHTILLVLGLVLACGRPASMQTITQGGSVNTAYLTSAATTNATSVHAGPAVAFGLTLINTTATIYYLRLYNLAAAPTCSSATGFVESIPIPASTTGAGVQRGNVAGQSFPVGLAFCLTGGGGSTDNTAAATGVYITILYTPGRT